jgi:hypothetical protein
MVTTFINVAANHIDQSHQSSLDTKVVKQETTSHQSSINNEVVKQETTSHQSSINNEVVKQETTSHQSSINNDLEQETTSHQSSINNDLEQETTSHQSATNNDLEQDVASNQPSNPIKDEEQYGYYTNSKFKLYKLLYILPIIGIIYYTNFHKAMSLGFCLFFLSGLFNNRFGLVIQSIKTNSLFWCTLVICLIILSAKYGVEKTITKKIIAGFLSVIIAMYIAWYVHYLSHTHDFRKIFNSLKNKTDHSSKYKVVNAIKYAIKDTIYFICDIFDFHSKIHHNPRLNKLWYNRVVEFLENFIMMSLPLTYLAHTYNIGLNISSNTFYLNKTISILWGLIYTTIHNINYVFVNPQTHKEHHMKDLNNAYNDPDEQVTNYGPDTIDIICDTKYKTNIIEDFNHGTINVIILTTILILIKDSNKEIFRKIAHYI